MCVGRKRRGRRWRWRRGFRPGAGGWALRREATWAPSLSFSWGMRGCGGWWTRGLPRQRSTLAVAAAYFSSRSLSSDQYSITAIVPRTKQTPALAVSLSRARRLYTPSDATSRDVHIACARAHERERERLSKNVFPPLYNNLPWRSRFFRFILLLQAGTRLFIPRFELLLFFVFGRHRLIFFQGPPASALPRPQLSFRSLLFFFVQPAYIYKRTFSSCRLALFCKVTADRAIIFSH